MLLLDLRPGDQVMIGNGITVKMEGGNGQKARLSFDAPKDLRIRRETVVRPEVLDARNGLKTR